MNNIEGINIAVAFVIIVILVGVLCILIDWSIREKAALRSKYLPQSNKKTKARKKRGQKSSAAKKTEKLLPAATINQISPPQVPNTLNQSIDIEPFKIYTEQIEPDDDVPTPSGAELTYLDAKALQFWDKKRTDYNIPPYYSENAFGRNVKPALQRLLDGGFLQVSDIEKNIGLKTVPELKSILAERELKISGNKSELIARLRENFDLDELEELFPVGVYAITEHGQKALEPYEIIRLNNEYGFDFSYYRLFEAKRNFPECSNEDILIKLMSTEIQKCYQSRNWSNYQRLVSRAAIFMKANGDPQKALECYILSFFVWTQEMKQYNILNGESQSYYMAKNIERCGIECGYSLSQLCKLFVEIVKKDSPFGLASQQAVLDALQIFKQSLGVDSH